MDERKPENLHDDRSAPMAVGDQRLERHIGFFGGTLLNSSGGCMLLVWVLGALFSMIGLTTFLELGTMLPRSGGEKVYLGYAFPEPKQLVSFLYMATFGILSNGGAIGSGAIAFGQNMIYAVNRDVQVDDWQARGVGVAAIVFWVIICSFSSKIAMRCSNVFVILTVLLLFFLVGVGFAGLVGQLPDRPDLRTNFSFDHTSPSLGSLASGMYFVIYSYTGYFNLQRVTDELVDPIKNLPRCGIASIALTGVLYVLANVAYLSVLSTNEISGSNVTVASALFDKAFGGNVFGAHILPALIAFSSFGFVVTYSASRTILEYAREGMLPFDGFFSHVNSKLNTPVRALFFVGAVSVVFVLAPPPGAAYEFTLSFINYGDYIFIGLCGVAVLVLRRTAPDLHRPIRAPISLVTLFVAICAFLTVVVFIPPTGDITPYPYFVPYVCWIGIVVLCVGLWYVKVVKYRALETSYNQEIRSIGNNSNETFENTFKQVSPASSSSQVLKSKKLWA
ncbi:amino acid/polyamine transporter I [Gongronella butleri]|nr:amino acid/polyamine transporter I [Gongronella butleri]